MASPEEVLAMRNDEITKRRLRRLIREELKRTDVRALVHEAIEGMNLRALVQEALYEQFYVTSSSSTGPVQPRVLH